MDILYSDQKLVVCIKPVGVLSTDEPGGMPSLLRAEALGGEYIYSVHRLDRTVGGVMVYAKTRHAAATLGEAMQGGAFQKEYRAVVRGIPGNRADTLTDLLRRDRRERKTYVVTEPGDDVRQAVLDHRVLATAEGLSLLAVTLHTGRTHQIRCQLAHHGLPLYGDRKYGLPDEEGTPALWSYSLRFPHPVTGETLCFSAPPPAAAPWTLFSSAGETL